MYRISYPLFKKNRILKLEMLENLRNFPRDFLDIEYQNYSDGIITGLMPTVYNNKITFSKGVIKHDGNLYVISEPLTIHYADTNNEVMIKLNFVERLEDEDFITQCVDIKLDFDLSLKKDQIELGRFKLKSGAYLRSDYKGLYDFVTEYNTINIINVLMSGQEATTINPSILKFFAKEVLETRTENMMDINFAITCLNSKRVEKQVITTYIGYKLNLEYKDMSNAEIHSNLVVILKMIQGDKRKVVTKMHNNTKIIID